MVGPAYNRPEAVAPAQFKEMPGWRLARPQDAAPKGAWWKVFNDPVLDGLEEQVAIGNQTLAADAAAYAASQALVDEARGALFPVLGAAPGVTRASSGASTQNRGSATRTQYSLQGNAAWTLDVWGSIRRQIQSDVANAQASAATLANARLSAQAQLATAYMGLRTTDALQRVLDETVANDRHALQITQNQYAAGTAARSDVMTAQTQREAAESQAINVGVARAQFEHAIAVQIGKAPAAVSIVPVKTVPAVPDIPGVLPSALLERRPDVGAAERTMAGENALIGVAVAAYYPTVDLTAAFGYAGNPLSALISSANRVWSLGASASETLFNGGTRSATVRAARATYDESVANYRATVLTAFQQVEDALANLRILAQQDAVDMQTVADATQAADIVLNEYRAGTQPYTAVIAAQNTLLAARQTQISVAQTRLTETVALIQALGGGWRSSDLPDKSGRPGADLVLP